jgi:asparagine synthetase A
VNLATNLSTLSPCEREQRVVEIYGAVFIEQIGAPLGDVFLTDRAALIMMIGR